METRVLLCGAGCNAPCRFGLCTGQAVAPASTETVVPRYVKAWLTTNAASRTSYTPVRRPGCGLPTF